MTTNTMVWQGAVSIESVPLFTVAQLTELAYDLDDAIHQIVDKHWAKHSSYDPVLRDKFIELVGLETATQLIEQEQGND